MSNDEKLEALIEAARMLGATQAKKGFGCYTQQDSLFEQAMHEAIQKHSAAIREALAAPEQEAMKESSVTHSHLWIGDLYGKEKNT